MGCPADRLSNGSLDLALDLLRIDGAPDVVDRDDLQHVNVAGVRVNLDLHRLRTVAMGDIGIALAGELVVRRGRPRHILEVCNRRPFLVLPARQRLLSRAFDGVAGHEGHAAGRHAAAVLGLRGILHDQLDLLRRHANDLSRDLRHDGVCPLADFSGGVAYDNPLDLARAVKFHRRVADIAVAEAEADVLETAGDAGAAQPPAGGRVEGGEEGGVWAGDW